MNQEVEGRLSLKVGDAKVTGPFALPAWSTLSMGRTEGYGLHLPNRWVPNKVCRFLPYELGWVVQVGPSPRMRVRGTGAGDHTFTRRSVVALQEGKTLLSFPEIDDRLDVVVVIGPGVATGLPQVHDEIIEDSPRQRTEYAARRITLTPQQRKVVASTFAYLLKNEPKPMNLAQSSAERLGVSTQSVKNALEKVRVKVNLERWGPDLESWEQVGHYLVQLTRNITWEDLPEDLL